MGIIAGFMVPHPPMIVPEIGRGEESIIEETTRAYERVAKKVVDMKPDTIIISSPHSVMYADYFHISPGAHARGSFSQFRAPEVKFEVDYDEEFVIKLSRYAAEKDIAAGVLGEQDSRLDHGTMVPLYFIKKQLREQEIKEWPKIVRVGLSGLSLATHYRFGMLVKKTAEELDRRVVYIASGDLSHKLQESGPYGYHPAGPAYDERIMEVMCSGEFDQLLDFDESFLEQAAECGHRSFVMLAGALDRTGLEIEKLSHQDVTGVGYGICTFIAKEYITEDNILENAVAGRRDFLDQWEARERERLRIKKASEDACVRLARLSLETYITGGKKIRWEDVKEEILTSDVELNQQELSNTRAGTFVSLHKNGKLRGCIGTITATQDSVAEEIIENAISASTRDPRFSPVTSDELDELEYSVDVLGPTERIDSEEQLDTKKYGVIVTKGQRRGLLLPNLDGVDTVEEQLAIAKQKAGLSPNEKGCRLERFEVVRHY